ncbi:addiction module protein [Candidatus Sumerlaeota bacterium]|nr:addiction module protein [Candidatus Sumerlaeota bacterium]
MKLESELDKVTASDKLAAIEELWTSLAAVPEDVPSPGWHAEVLDKREKEIQQ